MDELFKALMENKEKEDAAPATAEEILELGNRYLEKHDFHIGQLVTPKKGLSNYKAVESGAPYIIIDMEPGRRSNGDEGCNHEYEPSDIRIGKIRNGVLEGYWVDSNRFEPYVA